jgi:hypothetical protein
MKRRYMEMTEDIKEYAPTKGNPAEPSKKKKKKKELHTAPLLREWYRAFEDLLSRKNKENAVTDC